MHCYYRRDDIYDECLEQMPITLQLFDYLIFDVRRKLRKSIKYGVK